MTQSELKIQVAEILEIEPEELNENSSPENVETWDSVAALGIISMLDDEYDGDITEEEAEALKSYKAIMDFAEGKGIVDA